MTTVDRRLERIQAALSPKEAVLAWMAEAHGHGSLRAYVDTLRDAPDAAFPLIRLGQQMEQAVRTTMRGSRKPEAEVWPAVRLAVRDASFLYYLSSNLNWRVLQCQRANWLHIALVAEMLRGAAERESARHLALGWDQAREAAHTAYVQQGVVQTAAERCFDGVSPLFPEVATDVAAQVAEIERVIGIYNDVFALFTAPRTRRKRSRQAEPWPEPLDLARVRLEAEPSIRAELALVVDLSKAEALRLIGEQEQGYALVGRHVWPDGP